MKRISNINITIYEELEILKNFVDLKTGIIKNITSLEKGFEDSDLYITMTEPSRPWNTGLFPGSYLISEGNAASDNETNSILGAIGETLERYCPIYYDKNNFVYGSYNELNKESKEYINPDHFALFSEEQDLITKSNFKKDSRISWCDGYSLIDRKIKKVPAVFAYMPFHITIKEVNIFDPNSSGLAFGRSLEETILSGLNEVVERDAFAIYWLNKLEFPKIEFLSYVEELDNWYYKLFGKFNNQINLFNITTDIAIPSFFAVLKGRKEYNEPFLSVGAAAHIDPIKAIKKAILEAFHTRKYGMGLMLSEKINIHNIEVIKRNLFYNHVYKYTKPIDQSEIKFFYEPNESIKLKDILSKIKYNESDNAINCLKKSIDKIKNSNYDIIIVDVTSEDIAEKGFFSIKTIIPGLHPLWAGEEIPLGGKRIYEVPEKMGFKRKSIDDLNIFPHPFP